MAQQLNIDNINRDNFPSRDNLVTRLYNIKFNNCLNLMITKINEANTRNKNYIKIINNDNDITNIPLYILDDLKRLLITKNYIINNIENDNDEIIGFKIYW